MFNWFPAKVQTLYSLCQRWSFWTDLAMGGLLWQTQRGELGDITIWRKISCLVNFQLISSKSPHSVQRWSFWTYLAMGGPIWQTQRGDLGDITIWSKISCLVNFQLISSKSPHSVQPVLVRGGKSTKKIYSSKSTVTLMKFYSSKSKSTGVKIYSSKSKK